LDFFPNILSPLNLSACSNHLIVMESVGDYNLRSIVRGDGRLAIMIGITAIEILKQVHDVGFVHGKVRASNWVYFDPSDIAGSLSLIDFGRVSPFWSHTNNRHTPSPYAGNRESVNGISARYRSIFEIEKIVPILSRRDDWFLLCEMLLELAVGSVPTPSSHPVAVLPYITARMNAEYPGAPGVLVDMLEYAKMLDFSQRPDYEYWLGKLRAALVPLGAVPPLAISDGSLHGIEYGYVDEYWVRVDDWMKRGIVCECKNCPPRKFFVTERSGNPFEIYGGPLGQCVRSAVRRVPVIGSDGPGRLEGVIIKVPRKYWKEIIVADIYSDSGITPEVYTPSGVASACAACMIVMETAGSLDLEEYRMQRPSVSVSVALNVVIRAIELLKKFHLRGFVHGDIHMGNFSFKPGNFDSLKLIDLDRSVPFVDPIGRRHVRHVHQVGRDETEHVFRLNRSMLSVFELESLADGRPVQLSRRDDWFRLAETMINFFVLDNDLFKLIQSYVVERGGSRFAITVEPEDALRAKQERWDDEIPKIFFDFYKSTLMMGFTDRPPYELWQSRFVECL